MFQKIYISFFFKFLSFSKTVIVLPEYSTPCSPPQMIASGEYEAPGVLQKRLKIYEYWISFTSCRFSFHGPMVRSFQLYYARRARRRQS